MKNVPKIPTEFTQTIHRMWGQKGKLWLERLPELLAKYSAQWQLSEIQSFQHLNYNFVAKAFSKLYSTPVVLKLAIPEKEFFTEHIALTYFAGNGCVKLIAADLEHGALLLEALKPGTSLKPLFPLKDSEAVTHCVEVIQKLHTQPFSGTDTTFATIAQWLSMLHTTKTEKIPKEMLNKAARLSDQLLATQDTEFLLHGDLHHENILLSKRGWCAIDPKGVVGELAYEVGAFMRNPFPDLLAQPNTQQIIAQRGDQFSTQLKIDRQRIIQWSYVQSVLSACWFVHDTLDGWQESLVLAQVFEKELYT